VESRWRLNVADLSWLGVNPGLFARDTRQNGFAYTKFPNDGAHYTLWRRNSTPFGDSWTFYGFSTSLRGPGHFPYGNPFAEKDH